MSTPSNPVPPSRARASGTVLLPAHRFFVRRIPLVAGQDAVAQVELALETIGPFTPGQLYYGYRPSKDGTQALVFAGYRRNISTDTAGWTTAPAVLPDFAVWLGQGEPVRAGIWLHEQPGSLAVLVWDGKSDLPTGVLAREVTDESRQAAGHELVEEARRRFDGGSDAPLVLTDAVVAGVHDKEGLKLSAGKRSTQLSPAQLRAMDVRDKVELAGQMVRQKRDRWLWLAFASVVSGLAACIVVELGLQVSGFFLGRQRSGLEANAAAVAQVKQANQLAVRMENLAGQSLRPFEMLAVLNNVRPASLEFSRVSVSAAAPRQMEIDAQSGNASDPSDFEKAVARLSTVEKVELRIDKLVGGKTTFLVKVTFKPGFTAQGGSR